MTNKPITPGTNSFCSDEMADRGCIMPMAPRASQYGIAPEFVKKRLAEYPEMTSLTVKELQIRQSRLNLDQTLKTGRSLAH